MKTSVTIVHIFQILILFLHQISSDGNGFEDLDDNQFYVNRLKSAPRVKRIIGGSTYNNGQWPWLVSLKGSVANKKWGWIVTSYTDYYCGGALIRNNWVLTAAHCFMVPGANSGIRDPGNWNVKAGDVKRTLSGIMDRLKQFWYALTNQNTASWWYLGAEKIVIHPQYDSSSLWLNDIALLKLDDTIDITSDNQNVGLVTLPTSVPSDWPPPGANCSMQGWGCTYQGGPLQDYAMQVYLPMMSDEQCRQVYGNIAPTRFCAGYNLANKGICSGDSGGPLVCQDGTVWKQAGIASFTASNSPGDWPGAFTRVTQYLSWIDYVVNNY